MMLSDDGVAATGERRDEADGDGRDVILGIVSGDGGRARAGDTDGTRLVEVPLGRRL
jgi:hypothetical protein